MKQIATVLMFLLALATRAVAQQATGGWTALFNGKSMSEWDTYLGPQHDSAGKKLSTEPIGLNNDPDSVFRVVIEDGQPAIRISGRELGGLISTGSFSNYHLRLMFKWGGWLEPRRRKKDSGLLYHSVGRLGADNESWMQSQEFQIEQGNCGDYWGCAGATADIPARKISDSNYVFDRASAAVAFSAAKPAGRHCRKEGDAENATGEWNTLDLYCYGDTSVHVVNGKVVMVLYHLQRWDNGQLSPLTGGKLQLQSEGAEVFFRDIKIQPIDKIPAL